MILLSVKSKTNFSENENTHSEKNSNQCSYCEKIFKQPGNLRVHEIIHTGERSYSFNFCNKTFSDPSAFSKHKKIHVDENLCNIKVEFLETHLKLTPMNLSKDIENPNKIKWLK